ncbi:MAG: hypothetical protein JJD98_19970 [Polaromonas sp.]|nr:hypothetical protein [Polaromonas sp.]
MKNRFQSSGAVACAVSVAFVGIGLMRSDAPPVRAEAMERHEVRCDTQNNSVLSSDPADAKLACEGAHDAIDFLSAQGFDIVNGVSIVIVPKLPLAEKDSAAGLYLDSTAGCNIDSAREVQVLSFSAFKKFKNWFHIPIDASLYRSLVAHEVAHAISACNFKVAMPSIQAQEYIAYVTMFAAMAPVIRERILRQYPGHGYDGDWQMSTTIYLLDPMRFGVQAYRHFLKPVNGRSYLHAILAGEVMIE